MPKKDKKDKEPVQGDLLHALDALTGLIAKHDQREGAGGEPKHEPELGLDGLQFGSALDDSLVAPDERIQAPLPAVPTPREVEAVVELVLDHHLAKLRAQLKREILLELRKHYR